MIHTRDPVRRQLSRHTHTPPGRREKDDRTGWTERTTQQSTKGNERWNKGRNDPLQQAPHGSGRQLDNASKGKKQATQTRGKFKQ